MPASLRASLIAMVLLGRLASPANTAERPSFQAARPVWAKDRSEEMNRVIGFRGVVDVKDAGKKGVLRVAAR